MSDNKATPPTMHEQEQFMAAMRAQAMAYAHAQTMPMPVFNSSFVNQLVIKLIIYCVI